MKSSSLISKGKTILTQLSIVFAGVYLAFLFENFQNQKQITLERDKILTSLKFELEHLRIFFPEGGAWQKNTANGWDTLIQKNRYINFSTWRYIQPQHNFTTIEYAINTRETEIVDFEMHNSLITLFREIKQLGYTEEKMTEIGLRYKRIPSILKRGDETYEIMYAENSMLFFKFKDFAFIRGDIMEEIARMATHCLQLINKRLGPKKQRDVERRYFIDVLTETEFGSKLTKERALQLKQKHFPEFPDDEFEALWDEVKGNR